MAKVLARGIAIIGRVHAVGGSHLDLKTVNENRTIRLNSRNYALATGSVIGFQSKPAITVSKTADGVIGGEISPRVNSGVALAGGGTVVGLHVDTYLKGTAAGTISGSVRALELEQVTDDAGVRAITGDVNHIRIRSAFSATSIGGKFVPIRIEKAEAQTGSKQYDAVLDLPDTNAGVWNKDPGTELNLPGGTVKGYIKVLVGGEARYIALYEAGNLAD
jgi:hypothetical protein